MLIKVCGMKNPDNIQALAGLPIDFMGLIFYSKSPRYIGDLSCKAMDVLPSNIKRVGVFVNENINYILEKTDKYNLDLIQLHGHESPQFCLECRSLTNAEIIKAFSIAEVSDFEITKGYEEIANYFLFDTKTPQYGGSGQKFDWSILNEYNGNTPFFLSGGISSEDALLIKKIESNRMIGLDLNSRFEIGAGLKDIQLLDKFINDIRS